MEAVQESLEVQERVQQREAARDSKRRSQQAVQADIPADRGTLFDDTSAGPLVGGAAGMRLGHGFDSGC